MVACGSRLGRRRQRTKRAAVGSGAAGGWQKRAAVGGGDGGWRVGLERR